MATVAEGVHNEEHVADGTGTTGGAGDLRHGARPVRRSNNAFPALTVLTFGVAVTWLPELVHYIASLFTSVVR